MSETRTVTPPLALEWLLDAVEEVLCSCLYVENQPEYWVSAERLTALEAAYDVLMSFRTEDTTQETPHGAP